MNNLTDFILSFPNTYLTGGMLLQVIVNSVTIGTCLMVITAIYMVVQWRRLQRRHEATIRLELESAAKTGELRGLKALQEHTASV